MVREPLIELESFAPPRVQQPEDVTVECVQGDSGVAHHCIAAIEMTMGAIQSVSHRTVSSVGDYLCLSQSMVLLVSMNRPILIFLAKGGLDMKS